MSRNNQKKISGKVLWALALTGTIIGGAAYNRAYAQEEGDQFIVATPVENEAPMPAPIQNETRDLSSTVSEKSDSSETRQVALEVAGINQRMALMTAQLAELELKLKLAKMQEEIKNVGKEKKEEQSDLSKLDQMSFQNNFNQFPIPQKPVEMPAIKSSEITDGPTLVAVEGVDGDLRALVSETGRSVRKVRSGDKIGKWVVGNITMDSVTIKNGKEEKNLYIEYVSAQKDESSVGKSTGMSSGMGQQVGLGSMPFGQ